jgi:hypothetical protein
MKWPPPLPATSRARHVKQRGNKSLFAAFSSEKEDSSFFEKKKQKNFWFLVLWRQAFGHRQPWLKPFNLK